MDAVDQIQDLDVGVVYIYQPQPAKPTRTQALLIKNNPARRPQWYIDALGRRIVGRWIKAGEIKPFSIGLNPHTHTHVSLQEIK